MKVAITTWHHGENAGTFFQCFGLYSYLKERGHEVKVIDYKHISEDQLDRGFYYYASQLIPLIRRRLKRMRSDKQEVIFQAPFAEAIRQRNLRVQQAWGLIPLTCPVTTDAQFEALNDEFDAFVVGGDQVWNATMLNRRYFLDYVHPDKLKVAYGSSVGVGTVLPAQRRVYKKYVAGFNHVAVRERLLCDILHDELPDLHVCHLLDPSMLYPRESYLKMARMPQGIHPGSYVLCYFTPNTLEQEKMIRAYAEERGLKLVVIAMFGYSWTVKDADVVCVDPSEFLGLISNASAVFTSSFHCTIFSILFHRDLFVLERKQVSKSGNINQRYSEQLGTYDIMHRYIRYGSTLDEQALQPIDYNKVEVIFQQRLKDSQAFLNQIF